MDAPQENAIVVFLVLFLLLSFIVLQYQRANYVELKKQIVKEPKIVRWYAQNTKESQETEDTTNLSRKERRKMKKGKKKDEETNIDDYDDAELTKIMNETGVSAIGWTGEKPGFGDACVTVLKSPLTITSAVFSGLQAYWNGDM